jgi:hypothetical protein
MSISSRTGSNRRSAEVDAERVANYLVTTIDGSNLHRVTREDDPTPMHREMLEASIEQELLVTDDAG